MPKEKYILEAEKTAYNYFSSDGYYTGKSFTHHGERYAVVSKDISEAKVYSSKSRAIKVCKTEFSNYTFEVLKIDD